LPLSGETKFTVDGSGEITTEPFSIIEWNDLSNEIKYEVSIDVTEEIIDVPKVSIDVPKVSIDVPAVKEKIPDWIKNNAKWWSQGTIGDSDFVNGIEFLVSGGIINIPKTEAESQIGQVKLFEPTYLKLNADEFILPITRGMTTEIQINGYVENFLRGTSVFLTTENPYGEIERQQLVAAGGDYTARIILQHDSPVGEYKITTEYNEVDVDATSFTVIHKSAEIPDWIKNNAGWWADGLIGEDDFVNGIKYLVEKGIIKV